MEKKLCIGRCKRETWHLSEKTVFKQTYWRCGVCKVITRLSAERRPKKEKPTRAPK